MFFYISNQIIKIPLPDLPGKLSVGVKPSVESGLFIILLTGTGSGGQECIDNDDVKMR